MLQRRDSLHVQHSIAQMCASGELVHVVENNFNNIEDYKDSVFSHINSLLEYTFPKFRELITKKDWLNILLDFFKNHVCESNHVWNVPYEFYNYLMDSIWSSKLGIPFLNEIIHYEWLEEDVLNMGLLEVDQHHSKKPELKDTPVFNPNFRFSKFNFPVFTRSNDDLKEKMGEYYLIIYFDLENENVRKIELSFLMVSLIDALMKQDISIREALQSISFQLGIEMDDKSKIEILKEIQKLYQKNFILGVRLN